MGTRSELVGKKNAVVTSSSNFSGLGLRRMQESSCNNTSSSNKRTMVMPPPHNYYNNNNHDQSQLLSSSSSSSFSCGFHIGGGGGPMFCNTSNQVACMSDIYDVAGAFSGSGSSGTNNNSAVSKSLNPCITDPFFHFNSSSSGEMAAAAVNVNLRIPFTSDQLQELERQTLIYKYMVAF